MQKMKPLERILSLFVTPAQLMKNIKAHPSSLVPFLVCAAIGLASVQLAIKYSEIQTRRLSYASIERYGVDVFNLIAVDDEDDEAPQQISLITRAATVGGAAVSYPVAAFLSAAGLYVLTKIARGKELRFGQYFSMYMHLMIIIAAGDAAAAALGVALDTSLNAASLAAVFMPLGGNSSTAYNILSSVTVFNVWITILSIIGIKIINDFSRLKSIIVGAFAFAFSVAVSAVSLGMSFIMFDILDRFRFF